MSTRAPSPGDAMGGGRRVATIIVLGLLVGLGPFTIDVYLPAFPQVREAFDATDGQVQLTLAATTVGFALGQLVVGPLSDRLGRRIPLLVTNCVHVLASVGVLLAPTIEVLMGMRVLQGIGAAGSAVVSMAIARDLFSGNRLVTVLSRLALVSGLAPILAPMVGAFMLQVTDWRGLFVFLVIYGALVLAAQLLLLRETHPQALRTGEGSRLFDRYRRLFADRVYVGVILTGAAMWGLMFTYLSSASLVFQGYYGFSELQFGILFGVSGAALVVGTQMSSVISTRRGPGVTLAIATTWILVTSVLLLLLALTDAPAWTVVGALMLVEFGCGMMMPALQSVALGRHGRDAGTAASLLGAANMLGGSLVAPLLGMVPAANAVPMGAFMVGSCVLSIVLLWTIVRPLRVQLLVDEDAAAAEAKPSAAHGRDA